jgi:hypothetical protein
VRRILYSTSLTLVFSALALAGDGRPPRASSSDYPVHQETATATIAAVRVTPEQLSKDFPSDLAKKYIVVEVAIYPKDGPAFEVKSLDFTLKLGSDGGERHPDTAEDVAGMWQPHGTAHPDLKSNTHVTTETGVILANGQDPATGRRVNSVGTYESVGVSNAPSQAPASTSSSRVDADRMEALLKKWALPEGKTNSPVAGYLYFPLPAKKTKGALELQYERDGSTANLTLPAPVK